MRRGVVLSAGCLVLAAWAAGPARAHVPTEAETRQAIEVWRQYTECEKSRRFEPCWMLLSAGVRQAWADTGRKTAEAYAFVRGGEEITFESFEIVRIRRSPARLVLLIRATGRADTGPFIRTLEYAVIRERGAWRIDGRREGQRQTLP